VDKDHGRLENRQITVCTDIAWLQERHNWPGLQSIIMVEYAASGSAQRSETRYYIASLNAGAETLADAIRQHWRVENSLHWTMDVIFRDDDCRIRTKNAPANFKAIKHMAINLIRASKGKQSLQLKRHLAAWDQEFLQEIITK
jgi:predicted transposase YbfD/YdcC